MSHLHQHIAGLVDAWRKDGYPCESYPSITEILEYARDSDTSNLRFLRAPQLRALETYWCLRLVENTPHILELHRRHFPKQADLLKALGLDRSEITAIALNDGVDAVLDRIKTDDDFVRKFKLEALRETLSLDYPSYILALAMGAGKTILIGAIFATEFAMALDEPGGPFVQNALVFAPGTTIIESLRELMEVPYDRILPPRLHKPFAASVKITFTRDGEKGLPVIQGSLFNVVVTNTEKIRIQKETIRKSDLGPLLVPEREDEARSEVANLRLQAIASLPNLAVFSDEAHHTYGQSLSSDLKKVRKTVDYLAANTNLICVVNTTGTPYFQRQPLKDVVVWYGLSEGIRDGILKDLAGNIQAYDFEGNAAKYVAQVVRDFFGTYADVRLPDGAPARLAIYFPQTDDLKELRGEIDKVMVEVGQSPALCLVNTSDDQLTKKADIDAFNRLNDPRSPHRVVLLVNKGTEGWNCPSLFACALARRLRTSNNFVLQAATRCLRQVPGNREKARVYLSTDNYKTLDNQLRETYGETLADLNRKPQESRRARLVLRKLDIPDLYVTQVVRTVVKKDAPVKPLKLQRPMTTATAKLTRRTYTLAKQLATPGVLRQQGDVDYIAVAADALDTYAAAVDLAARYRLDPWAILDELRRVYGQEDVPQAHLDELARQVEQQTRAYEVREETVEKALALVRKDGFTLETAADGTESYVAEIVYPLNKEHLLLRWEALRDKNTGDFGFHYDPYHFDSRPEMDLFEQLLAQLNLRPEEVEDIYFTGGLTDRNKTDFHIQYKDARGKWHTYTPDFIVRKKPKKGRKPGSGRVYILEVKPESERDDPINGVSGAKALAMRRLEGVNPERLKYEIVFAPAEAVPGDRLAVVRKFCEEAEA